MKPRLHGEFVGNYQRDGLVRSLLRIEYGFPIRVEFGDSQIRGSIRNYPFHLEVKETNSANLPIRLEGQLGSLGVRPFEVYVKYSADGSIQGISGGTARSWFSLKRESNIEYRGSYSDIHHKDLPLKAVIEVDGDGEVTSIDVVVKDIGKKISLRKCSPSP